MNCCDADAKGLDQIRRDDVRRFKNALEKNRNIHRASWANIVIDIVVGLCT